MGQRMAHQQERKSGAAGEGRQQEAVFAPSADLPGAGLGAGDAGVGAKHGRSPPHGAFGARKKARPTHEKLRAQGALWL